MYLASGYYRPNVELNYVPYPLSPAAVGDAGWTSTVLEIKEGEAQSLLMSTGKSAPLKLSELGRDLFTVVPTVKGGCYGSFVPEATYKETWSEQYLHISAPSLVNSARRSRAVIRSLSTITEGQLYGFILQVRNPDFYEHYINGYWRGHFQAEKKAKDANNPFYPVLLDMNTVPYVGYPGRIQQLPMRIWLKVGHRELRARVRIRPDCPSAGLPRLGFGHVAEGGTGTRAVLFGHVVL